MRGIRLFSLFSTVFFPPCHLVVSSCCLLFLIAALFRGHILEIGSQGVCLAVSEWSAGCPRELYQKKLCTYCYFAIPTAMCCLLPLTAPERLLFSYDIVLVGSEYLCIFLFSWLDENDEIDMRIILKEALWFLCHS